MNTTKEKELSDSLLAACRAAGIEKPKYIAQDEDGDVFHYGLKPTIGHTAWKWAENNENDNEFTIINHPPYTNWQDSLLEWVEPLGESLEEQRGTSEPLADVLARHPEHIADVSKMIEPSGIEAEVCADIAKRQQLGIAKYKMTVAENPLTHAEWLQHAYEECLDMAVYLKRAMAEKGGEKL